MVKHYVTNHEYFSKSIFRRKKKVIKDVLVCRISISSSSNCEPVNNREKLFEELAVLSDIFLHRLAMCL